MTTSPTSASVPAVVGMTYVNALQALLSRGYHVTTVQQASSVVPPGVVISMSPPPGTRLALGSTVELTVSATVPRKEPVRIVRMSIEPDLRRLADGPLVIVAELDPGPDQAELQWWMEQLRDRVNVRAWGGSVAPGSPTGGTTVQVEAPDDQQLDAVARRLVAAIEEANAAYPERYEAWRREHDARVAEERRREERRSADRQAILDRVMDEYRSNQ